MGLWKQRALLILIFALLGSQAVAHDFWIEKTPEGFSLYRGHRSSSHPGEATIEYDPHSILEVLCSDEQGPLSPIEPEVVFPMRIGTGCRLIHVLFSSGYWTKTPYGTKNIPKTQVEHPLESWLSYESVKYIDSWNEDFIRPLTGHLELAPLSNPLLLGVGDKLRLLVTKNKVPVNGAVVTYDGKPRGLTGADGQINIRLRHPDLQLIQTTISWPLDSIEADTEIHTAALCFRMGEKP
ncbi:MAG: DUF4198 domain-containing protein [Candidatus Eisenbacteria bacterium]|uniref:DUF4198 domain-containing protein n=1 Tax=Eiseniibacteriota bacterium TaxID=2212470 RepID=A0A948S0Q4_UNCEI|nr:DUF4198 domain-containing protein [Candidatus Eisenbacteria bacterium]MBU2692712.1 DUF4198 domain-containing protein [Candidatus Eisenbacteria bacterium]